MILGAVLVALACASAPADAEPDTAGAAASSGAAPRRARGDKVREREEEAERAQRRLRPGERPSDRLRARSGPVTVPIDVGVGPTALFPNPPAFTSQPVFTGLALSLAAVADRELIARNADRIPPSLRQAARNLDEVRIRPWYLALVPELLVISPAIEGLSPTGMYGAVWRPVGFGLSLVDKPVNLSLNAALDLAYLYVHSSVLGGGTTTKQSETHVLRPGVNLELVLEIPVTKSFLLSTGWSSDLFVPQPFGHAPVDFEPLDDALWHLGGPFLKAHVRIPYSVDL